MPTKKTNKYTVYILDQDNSFSNSYKNKVSYNNV